MPDFVFRAADFSDAEYQTTLRQFLNGLVVGDWRQALLARGLGWNVTIGSFSTPIVGGGAGTVLDLDQPEGVLSVPSGYCLVPLRISIQCQPPLIAADNDEIEALIAVDRTAAASTDGTSTPETPLGLRTDISSGCPIVCTSAYTADMTATTGADPVLSFELARAVKVADVQGTAANAKFDELQLVYEPANPPFIVGPAAVYLYWGGTVATSGFAQCNFLAFSSALVTNLV